MYVFSARPFENHLCERLPCLKIINNNNKDKTQKQLPALCFKNSTRPRRFHAGVTRMTSDLYKYVLNCTITVGSHLNTHKSKSRQYTVRVKEWVE